MDSFRQAELVDPAEAEVGGGHVDRGHDGRDLNAGHGGLHEVGVRASEYRAEQVRPIVQRHVDTGDLLEDEEEAHHNQRPAHARCPGRATLLLVPAFHLLDDLGRGTDVLVADVTRAQRGHGLAHVVVPPVPQQPPWRLRHLGPEGQPDEGGKRAQAEHEPPADGGGAAREGAEDDQGDDVGDEDADRDHPLLQHREGAAPVFRRVLGDVGGGDRGVRPDGQADQRPREKQHGGVRGDGGQDRARRVDPGVHDQERLAAEAVGRRASQEGSRRRAQRRPRH